MNATVGPFMVTPEADGSCLTHDDNGELAAHVYPTKQMHAQGIAAGMSAWPEMLNALIVIHQRLQTDKGVFDLEDLSEITSIAFEKIVAEMEGWMSNV